MFMLVWSLIAQVIDTTLIIETKNYTMSPLIIVIGGKSSWKCQMSITTTKIELENSDFRDAG